MRRREASARECTTDTEVGVRLAVRVMRIRRMQAAEAAKGGQSVRKAMDPCR